MTRVERWVPGLRALREYQRSWLASDLVAGLVLTALLVPVGMGYAQAAGLPPITGLSSRRPAGHCACATTVPGPVI